MLAEPFEVVGINWRMESQGMVKQKPNIAKCSADENKMSLLSAV